MCCGVRFDRDGMMGDSGRTHVGGTSPTEPTCLTGCKTSVRGGGGEHLRLPLAGRLRRGWAHCEERRRIVVGNSVQMLMSDTCWFQRLVMDTSRLDPIHCRWACFADLDWRGCREMQRPAYCQQKHIYSPYLLRNHQAQTVRVVQIEMCRHSVKTIGFLAPSPLDH